MAIYFRVRKDATEQGTLYGRKFKVAYHADPQPDDLIITMNPQQYLQVKRGRPEMIVFRVLSNKYSQDISEGKLYDENLELLSADDLKGNVMLLAYTPDEFELMRASRQ